MQCIIMEEKESQGAYFKLMEVVGSSGKYQNIVLGIFCVVVYSVGSLSLGGPYYFAVAPYTNCPDPNHTASECSNYVCSLPAQQRSQYLQPEMAQLRTLGNQFGDFHCQNADIISNAMGMFFLGSIFGYICTGPLVDNFGRKNTFNACLLLGLFGNLLVACAVNLALAEIGLLMMGFGLQNSFNLCFYFLSEQFENRKRQIGGVIIQSCFCIGGLATILWFFSVKNWRTIFWVFYFMPLTAVTLLAFRYLKETPRFLIKRLTATQIRSQLRFIAKLNGREAIFQQSQYTSQSGLQQLKDEEVAECQASQKKYFTFIDLFRYSSLRSMSVHLGIVGFSVDFLYYAPVMLMDQFGFDFYLNGVLLNISELITYAVSYFLIDNIKRKKLALWMFTAGLACSIVLFFLHSDAICEQNCWNAKTVLQFMTVLLLRFAVALEFQVFIIYLNELYPTQVAGMGFSYVSVVSTLPSVFIPQLITLCNRYGINIMIFFCLISGLGIFSSSRLKQTQGKAPQEKIRQFGCKPVAAEIQLVQQAMGS